MVTPWVATHCRSFGMSRKDPPCSLSLTLLLLCVPSLQRHPRVKGLPREDHVIHVFIYLEDELGDICHVLLCAVTGRTAQPSFLAWSVHAGQLQVLKFSMEEEEHIQYLCNTRDTSFTWVGVRSLQKWSFEADI